MPDRDLDLLVEAAHASGEIARRHFRRAPQVWEKPDGHGPVTQADLDVNTMLRGFLLDARPDYGWLSEETPDTPDRLAAARVFILDPIDGTRAFISGEKTWAHSIAIAEEGRVIAGVVHLPMLDRTYAARLGDGARLNGAPIAASTRADPDGARLLAASAALDPAHWPGGVPKFERHFRPSLAYRLCLVAEGRFDAMLTFRDAWEWDVAAGDLILREAGGATATRLGEAPPYNRPHPAMPGMIATAAPLLGAVLGRLG